MKTHGQRRRPPTRAGRPGRGLRWCRRASGQGRGRAASRQTGSRSSPDGRSGGVRSGQAGEALERGRPGACIRRAEDRPGAARRRRGRRPGRTPRRRRGTRRGPAADRASGSPEVATSPASRISRSASSGPRTAAAGRRPDRRGPGSRVAPRRPRRRRRGPGRRGSARPPRSRRRARPRSRAPGRAPGPVGSPGSTSTNRRRPTR